MLSLGKGCGTMMAMAYWVGVSRDRKASRRLMGWFLFIQGEREIAEGMPSRRRLKLDDITVQ